MSGDRKKILIVEDDNVMRNLLTDQLGREYEIVQAENGELGLKFAESFRPDLIILDLLLPVLGGLDMLELLRKKEDPELANTKVIIFSNFSDNTFLLRAQGLNVLGYYIKANTEIADLLEKIKKSLTT
jgi:DNA-binding response OmpR family regulator